MLLGYRMKKRSMPAYDKVIVPELKGYRSEEQPLRVPAAKRHIKSAFRAAACAVLAFVLIGVIVSRNTNNTAGGNSFTLVAYAASDAENLGMSAFESVLNTSAGVTMQKNTKIALPVSMGYLAVDSAGNEYISRTYNGGRVYNYRSAFQFSAPNVDSITMTAEKGLLAAVNYENIDPIFQKYAKADAQGHVGLSEEQMSDSEKEIWKASMLRGKTVTFPPNGFTAYWVYTLVENEKTSDTIYFTVKFVDGSSQKSVMSIGENADGVITAILN